ncbi:DUF3253 domain-containing protein [Rathayibacter sp. VKM Ac-2804]|uniref:DUF2256 and DUF3253 domain-containing protein n=1 Tax=Rathayibacter TaxID=33886 RepID=UPI00132F3666|nr:MULTISPECIES: DUF2256 and DUF3253 domain-containing protein [Rathayibacter]MDY0911948.1 DUF2256 and DUF3253 domain-containing protein [Rathayibacter festucae]NRG42938.1 DUF2256 and DUF3253 domain-containing protein [Rathayibacter sp. VKM Ac-2835]QHF24832.1 DUF3253 domain-containing protein [Rathayibacter sp. VKM Ac-2804]
MAHRPRESSTRPENKTCASCGREIEWRAKWARDWENVRYCSDACRRRGVGPEEQRLEEEIRTVLLARAASSTACPSEVARRVGGEEWRPLMEPVRRAARRLVDRGEIDIVQGGQIVDPSRAKGPIRLRRRPGGPLSPGGGAS